MTDAERPYDRARWESETLAPVLERAPERRSSFATAGGRPIHRVYGPDDLPDLDYAADLGDPGRYPYTRGLFEHGYRDRLWTMQQAADVVAPEEANARYRDLIAAGATGLTVAFDAATCAGRDADDPLAAGDVGRGGVSVASVEDMDLLLDGIDIAAIDTAMTIDAPAGMLLAMFLVVAERRGVAWSDVPVTIHTDVLDDGLVPGAHAHAWRPPARLVTDLLSFAVRHVPRSTAIAVGGYRLREAGATAVQELAIVLGKGIEYVEWGRRAGLDVDAVAPLIAVSFDVRGDLFEEIAKFRAARALWARAMRERFGARDPGSWCLRCHARTSAASLSAEQPYDNVSRTALQALAAILGGAASLETLARDQVPGPASAEAGRLALRTQQVLAFESGLAGVVDAFGGSWFLERLTRDLEAEAQAFIDRVAAAGGTMSAIEGGLPRRQVEDAAAGDPAVARRLADRVTDLRRRRDGAAVTRALDVLRATAHDGGNLMPSLIDCARASVTLGEMCRALGDVRGESVARPSI